MSWRRGEVKALVLFLGASHACDYCRDITGRVWVLVSGESVKINEKEKKVGRIGAALSAIPLMFSSMSMRDWMLVLWSFVVGLLAIPGTTVLVFLYEPYFVTGTESMLGGISFLYTGYIVTESDIAELKNFVATLHEVAKIGLEMGSTFALVVFLGIASDRLKEIKAAVEQLENEASS